eukprot:COSAG06_NODE_16652_length_988_cov_8.497188_1_plen_270_part_00
MSSDRRKTSRASATDLGMPHDDYFFEQQDESMCAKHALNNLMQEALFNEVSMSEIALDLDAQESEVMNSEADGDYDPGTSNHVREDGYFSIEVIAAALSRYGVHLTNLNVNLAAKAAGEGKAYPPYDPGKCEGFLIASHDHFYCIRRLGGKDAAGRIESVWFVLNSTESTPKYVETSKLRKTLEKAGWSSVYVATGLGERSQICADLESGGTAAPGNADFGSPRVSMRRFRGSPSAGAEQRRSRVSIAKHADLGSFIEICPGPGFNSFN